VIDDRAVEMVSDSLKQGIILILQGGQVRWRRNRVNFALKFS